MSFDVASEAYDRFMGRYSAPLAGIFADFADLPDTARVVDVGCGTGALTDVLVERFGTARVRAVDPSTSIVTALASRHPDLELSEAGADVLPFDDDEFDGALAQLVVHFMPDGVAGLAEMARVTKPGGVVAACVWDYAEGGGPATRFWDVANALDPDAPRQTARPGTSRGSLEALLGEAGLGDIVGTELTVTVTHPTFDEWWEPYTLGVGPAGAYIDDLDAAALEELRERCREALPPEPFDLSVRAWAARGTV